MPPSRKHELTAKELASFVREVAWDEGGYVSFHRFRQITGVPHSEVYRHFRSWDDLLALAEIEKPRHSPRRLQREDLLAEYHRFVDKFWKLPTVAEFTRHARVSWGPIWTTFNGQSNLIAAYRDYLDRITQTSPSPSAGQGRSEATIHSNPNHHIPIPCPPTPVPSSNPWVRRRWASLRLGFEWNSSKFPAEYRHQIDVLICWTNDTPSTPIPTIELSTAAPWLKEWIDLV